MFGQDVPIGGRVKMSGRVYECESVNQREDHYNDCKDCDLYGTISCMSVFCSGDARKDGQWVVYKEVKQ